jgi:hypothetical protein
VFSSLKLRKRAGIAEALVLSGLLSGEA